MRVLGIDPGTRVTGFGVIESGGGSFIHIENGNIEPGQKLSLAERLREIMNSLRGLMERYKPDYVAVEEVFVAKNVRSSLMLGHARGVALAAAADMNIGIAEYTPSEVKKALTGTGGASKEQVQQMVKVMLGLPEVACEDASDALAVAICHCNTRGFLERIAEKA